MNTNSPTLADIYARLTSLVEDFKSLELSSVESANLVPTIKAVADVGAFAAAIHAQIELRALTNGEMLPGVVVKDAVTHRKWHSDEAAEQLAREEFGDKAFVTKLLSPAQIEKLGEAGEQFVAVASYKPEAGKRVVY
jgi:hypothetical protein